jgi:hypothetical protein
MFADGYTEPVEYNSLEPYTIQPPTLLKYQQYFDDK